MSTPYPLHIKCNLCKVTFKILAPLGLLRPDWIKLIPTHTPHRKVISMCKSQEVFALHYSWFGLQPTTWKISISLIGNWTLFTRGLCWQRTEKKVRKAWRLFVIDFRSPLVANIVFSPTMAKPRIIVHNFGSVCMFVYFTVVLTT